MPAIAERLTVNVRILVDGRKTALWRVQIVRFVAWLFRVKIRPEVDRVEATW